MSASPATTCTCSAPARSRSSTPTPAPCCGNVAYSSSPNDSLVLDLADSTLWVVDIGAVPSYAREFDMVSLRPLRTVHVLGTVFDAVELDEQLYLATSGGVFTVAAGLGRAHVGRLDDTRAAGAHGRSGDRHRASRSGRARAPGSSRSPTTARRCSRADAQRRVADDRRGQQHALGRRRRPGRAAAAHGSDRRCGRCPRRPAGWSSTRAPRPSCRSPPASPTCGSTAARTSSCCASTASSGDVLQRWNGITQSVATGGSGPYAVTDGTVVPLVLRGNCLG